MNLTKFWSGIGGLTKIWIAYLMVGFVAPYLLPPAVRSVVLPPLLVALVATAVIEWFRPRLDPLLRRAVALLIAEAAWFWMDQAQATVVTLDAKVGILAAFALSAALMWRPSTILVGVLIGGAGFAASKAIFQILSASHWNFDTADEALHAVLRLTIVLFAFAALRMVNRERNDARFDDEVFSEGL